MVFYWNPLNRQSQQLTIREYNGMGTWAIDKRVHVAPISGQRYIKDYTGIDTNRANTLDFWTLDRRSLEPQNLRSCMQFLEEIFRKVQNDGYDGVNPPTMS